MSAKVFNDSCALTTMPCTPGNTYIDPCSCSNYYVCTNGELILLQICPSGTAYIFSLPTFCRITADVIPAFCDEKNPWNRCVQAGSSSSQIEALKSRCSNEATTTTTQKVFDSNTATGDSGGASNGGAIAGVVIAIIIVAALVVLIVIYVRRKGNPITNIKNSQLWRRCFEREEEKRPQTPRLVISSPLELQPEEGEYAAIDEVKMFEGKGTNQTLSPKTVVFSKETVHTKPHSNFGVDPTPRRNGHPVPPSKEELDKVGQKPVHYTACDFLNKGGNGSASKLTGDDGYAQALLPSHPEKRKRAVENTMCDLSPESDNCYLTPEPDNCYLTPESDNCYLTPEPDNCYLTPESDNCYLTPESDNCYLTPESDNCYLTPESDNCYPTPESVNCCLTPESVNCYLASDFVNRDQAP